MTSAVVEVDADRQPGLGLREAFESRELLLFMAWRQIRVIYQQALFGVGWVVVQPLVTMGVFTLVFGRLAGLPTNGLDYAVFYTIGLVPWTFASKALQKASSSLVDNQPLITKTYVPRLLIPVAPVVAGLVDLAVGALIIGGVMVVSGTAVAATAVFAPLWLFLLALVVIALGIAASALNAIFRDTRFVVQFGIQLWLFVTPLTYGSDLIPERYRELYHLNPVANVVDGLRASLTGVPGPSGRATALVVGMTVLGLAASVRFFRAVEGTVADAV